MLGCYAAREHYEQGRECVCTVSECEVFCTFSPHFPGPAVLGSTLSFGERALPFCKACPQVDYSPRGWPIFTASASGLEAFALEEWACPLSLVLDGGVVHSSGPSSRGSEVHLVFVLHVPPSLAQLLEEPSVSAEAFSFGVCGVPKRRIGGSGTSTCKHFALSGSSSFRSSVGFSFATVTHAWLERVAAQAQGSSCGSIAARGLGILCVLCMVAGAWELLCLWDVMQRLFFRIAAVAHDHGLFDPCMATRYDLLGVVGVLGVALHLSFSLDGSQVLIWLSMQATSVCYLFAVAVWVRLWQVQGVCLGFQESVLGRICIFQGRVNGEGLRSLGAISHVSTGPLDWRSESFTSRRERRRLRGSATFCRTGGRALFPVSSGSGFGVRFWVGLLGFMNFPVQVSAGHLHGVPLTVACACLSDFLGGAGAVGVASSADRRPHEIPIEEVADYFGPPIDFEWGLHEVAASPDLLLLPTGPEDLATTSEHKWLGVTVMTPHSVPVRIAVKCRHGQGVEHVARTIIDAAPGTLPGLYDVCVPANPTRFEGYGTFLRFPSTACACPEGEHVAVILDLSYVGGAYYACILPQDIPYDTLEDFVLRQTTYSEAENLVHIGDNPVPHTAGVPLHLHNGDVITFRRPPQVWHARQSVEALFADRGRWGPISDMPSPVSTSGLLVQHGLERVFLPAHHHYGQTPLEAICTAWDYEPGQCTICAFPTPTVEFRGNRCSHVVCVMPFSSRQLRGHSNCRRRDVFALCDLRGIGFGVRVAHSHVYEFHIPSIAAIFGCSLDPSKHLAVVGRPDTESDVPVAGHAVFTVRAVANDSLVSDDLLEGGGPSGHDESEDEDALPTSELVARLWPSAVAARGRDATLTTVGRLSRRRSRSRSRPKQQLSFAAGAKVGSAEDGISRACFVLDAPLLPPFGSRDACQVLPDKSGAAVGDLVSLKLLQEPTSHSLPDRDRVEQAREFLEGEGRLWPYVPATDQFAVQRAAERDQTTDAASTDGESDFTFFLHKLDFVPETVVLSLVPPIEVYDALEQLQEVRDQAHRHLYPSLVVADPQPHQGSGVVLALPAWVEHDTVVIFDLAEYDGRQFASSAPAMASKAVLLQLCEVELDRADVYIGNSNVPLAEETVPLWTGVCVLSCRDIFFQDLIFICPTFCSMQHCGMTHRPYQSDLPVATFAQSARRAIVVSQLRLPRLLLTDVNSLPGLGSTRPQC